MLKLKFYERKRDRLKVLIDKVEKQIEILTTQMYGDSNYRDHVRNKHCIVCANRIAERDFKIPDGIVCGHPSNQTGKDMFRYYCHTCEHWKRENVKKQ
jgi:hypothetical protein